MADRSEISPEIVYPLGVSPVLLPGDDPEQYRDLAVTIQSAFPTASPYAKVLVGNLIQIEWDLLRVRRQRDELYLAAYGRASQPPDMLLSPLTSQERQAAPDEIQLRAQALTASMQERELLERTLGNLEERRRRLIRDIDAVNLRHRGPIEDAELSEPE